MQANAGDINPITGIGWGQDNTDEKNRLGLTLGAEVLKVLSSIYTESTRGPGAWAGSLSKIPYYPRIPIQNERHYVIKAKEETLELLLHDLPRLEEAKAILEKWKSEVSILEEKKTKGASYNAARIFLRWAHVLCDYVERGGKAALQISIQALQIGDIAIVGVPGETFSLQGLQVKRASPFTNTLFLGYSNGCVSYLPTCDAYPIRGWSVQERYYVPDMIFQAYLLPTALQPDSSDRIVEKSLNLLREFL